MVTAHSLSWYALLSLASRAVLLRPTAVLKAVQSLWFSSFDERCVGKGQATREWGGATPNQSPLVYSYVGPIQHLLCVFANTHRI